MCGFYLYLFFFFFFKQKTAYEMRISDWSSDVCSSDLARQPARRQAEGELRPGPAGRSHRPQGAQGRLALVRGQLLPALPPGGAASGEDRKSVVSGKSVSVRVDLGGRRIIKKKKNTTKQHNFNKRNNKFPKPTKT